MLQPWWKKISQPKYRITLLVLGLVLLGAAAIGIYQAVKSKKAYKIGIILSQTDLNQEDRHVLEFLVNRRLESLNKEGGINGRPLQAFYLDDKGDTARLSRLVAQTITDEDLIAYLGAQGIARAMALGPLLTRERVPYIGNYVYTQFTQKYPTMYTAGLGVKEGTLLFAELLRTKATRVGFIGQENSPQSAAFLKGIQALDSVKPEFELTWQRFYPAGYQFKEEEKKALADTLREQIDFLVYGNEPKSIYPLLEVLRKYELRIPVYCGLTDLAQLDASHPAFKAAELYDLNSFGIPSTHNKRLQENLVRHRNGFNKGPQGEYQVGLGSNIADGIGLVAEAARESGLPAGSPVREKINKGLTHYINGRRIFRGWFSDLYFTADKAFAGNLLVAWKPRNRSAPVLAPVQYLIKDSTLQPALVLYTSLDMVKIEQVNDEEGTFLATFYLQLQSEQSLEMEQLDFTNAVRNAINHEPLLEARLIRSRKDTTGFGFYHYLYKISGKFYFEADLYKYPLDEQFFPVSIQTSNALKPFYIQPAAPSSRDTIFEATGWRYQDQFVGFDQEIISSANAFNAGLKNLPYYKFTFVYAMKRSSIDYFLKTLMPLFTILTIAYFSVYIPPREFEALAAMQVTALLSSIALYFSTFKPQIQYATTSDKIFIFSYVIITTLIATSILIYITHRKYHFLKRMAQVYQRFLFPLIVIGFSIYVRWF